MMAESARPIAVRSRTQPERQAISDAAMEDAAVALICGRGPAATTLKDVGVHAGYSRGLAGYRFGTKAGLWSHLVGAIGEEWLAELRRAATGTRGLATVHAALDAHRELLLDPSLRIRAFYVLWFHSVGPDPELRARIARIHDRRRRDVARWIEDGIADGAVRGDVDPTAVADQFVAQVVGIAYQWLVDGPQAPDPDRVTAQHENLKNQMTRELAPTQER